MKGIKFTKQTSNVAICLFTIYLLYGLFYLPVFDYLSCLTIGAITYGITKSYELSLMSVLAGSIVFQVVKPRVKVDEGFTPLEGAPLIPEVAVQPTLKKERDVQGLSSSFSEGFEGANATTGVINVTATPASAPAAALSAALAAVPNLTQITAAASQQVLPTAQSVPAAPAAAPAAPQVISQQGVPAVTQPAESFEDNGGLFKLGKIPTDDKGGFHIDSGTSILNALKSLKPDQIQSMTQDTKQLIETQKSLMGMLQSFKPMMSEGKEMMATFQHMFSPTSTAPGSINGALQAAGNPIN
jgi:hypothetical protein